MIYFIQGEITRRIKIGFTAQFINSRIRALQTGSPDKIIFLGARPGSKIEESRLHAKFHKDLSHGEWFHETNRLNLYIQRYCFHDTDIAEKANSLVLSRSEKYKNLLQLEHEKINNIYMMHLVRRLEGMDRLSHRSKRSNIKNDD